MRGLSFRSKIILGTLITAIVPLCILLTVIISYLPPSLEELTREKTVNIAETLAAMVSASLQGEARAIEVLAADPQIQQATQTDQYEQIKKKLHQAFIHLGETYEGLFITDRNGIVRMDAVGVQRHGFDLRDREYFQQAKKGLASISDPVFSKATGSPVVVICQPLIIEGQFTGIVAAPLKIDYLMQQISNIKLGQSGSSFMLNSAGIVISHPQKETILNVNMTQIPGMEQLARAMAGQETGAELFTLAGERRIAGFAPIAKTGWSVAVTQNRDEFLSPAGSIFRNILLFTPIALFVAIIIGIISARSTSQPVLELTKATRAIADGDWQQVPETGRKDELGEVAESFNRMATQLQGLFTALQESEKKYRDIFENAIEGIFQVTLDGRVLSANPALVKILGYESKDDLINSITNIGEQVYVDPGIRDKMVSLLLEQGELVNAETRFKKKDGTTIWVSFSSSLVRNDAGEPFAVEGLLTDISERKKSEEEVLRLNEELEQRVIERTSQLETANTELRQITSQLETAYQELKAAQSRVLQQEKMASIGQLAAGVAHEINNPMGFIISNLNSLQRYSDKIISFMDVLLDALEKMLPDHQAQYSELIEKVMAQKKSTKLDYVIRDLDDLIKESLEGADRVRKIVQDLKSFSRLDAFEYQQANINAGLDSTINIIWNELKYKAKLVKEYGQLPDIMCNLGQLNQAFMNLLMNAAQAIEGQKGEIRIRTEHRDDAVRVTISDNGTGIPKNALDRIFDPFFTTKDVGEGTGLGLSIVYDIIKKHHGEIAVDSSLGQGTSFSITLPINPLDETLPH